MKAALTLASKEFRDAFRSPLIFLFLIAILLVSHQLFLSQFFFIGQASLKNFFIWIPLLWVFLPLLTMDRWAGEQRQGTLDLLKTLPVSCGVLALGKFLACLMWLTLTLALTLPLAITVAQWGALDGGIVASSYLGCWLLGAFSLSLGLWFSKQTRLPIVALILATLVLSVLTVIASPLCTQNLPAAWQPVLAFLSLDETIQPFLTGLVPLKGSLYLMGLTALFFYAQTRATFRIWQIGALLFLGLAFILAVQKIPNTLFADLTQHKTHSLSPQTTAILQELEDRVTFKLYFSQNVPFEVQQIENDLEDLLLTLAHHSRYDVVVENVDVSSENGRERARQIGITPLQMTVREQNSEKVQEIYLGFSVHYQDKMNVIALAANPQTFEYQIALSLLKLTAKKIPQLGVLLPEGPRRLEYNNLLTILDELADVVVWDQTRPPSHDVAAWLILDPLHAPDTLGSEMDAALAAKIPVILFLTRTEVSDSVTQKEQITGLESHLQKKGITLTPELVLDNDHNAPAQFDLGGSQVLLDYPFWLKTYAPDINTKHPVTAGLEELLIPWSNALQFSDALMATAAVEILAQTSSEAFLQEKDNLSVSPQYVTKMQTLPQVRSYPIAAQIQFDSQQAPFFIVSDTQMVRNNFLNPQYFTEALSNASFATNLIEYATWGDHLIGLRSREQTVAPIVKLSSTQKNVAYGALMAAQVILPGLVWLAMWASRRWRVRRLVQSIGSNAR